MLSILAPVPASFSNDPKHHHAVKRTLIVQKPIKVITTITTTAPQLHKGNAYSIQLAARQNKADLTQFMQQHNLSGQTRIYQTQVNGQRWYVLLYGNFPSRTAAYAAVKQLPTNLQQPGFWVRPTP